MIMPPAMAMFAGKTDYLADWFPAIFVAMIIIGILYLIFSMWGK